MKLLIAIPTNDQMPFQFVESLTKLIRRLDADGIDYDVAFQGGTLVHVGRDKLALKAITGGYSHILWLDSDMVFTEDLLSDLMDARKDFVTGIAHARREPYAGSPQRGQVLGHQACSGFRLKVSSGPPCLENRPGCHLELASASWIYLCPGIAGPGSSFSGLHR